MGHDLLREMAQRYVAGEDLADGIVVAQTLNTQGLLVSLDHLGESVRTAAEARRAGGDYVDALDAIARDQVDANISLKLTQLGLDLGRDLAVAHLRSILQRAATLRTFVRIDMESSAYTQRTLDIHRELWQEGSSNVGIVLQAALYRTAADVEAAIELGTSVRLVKGAYLEPSSIAYADKAAVDANYARLLERLLTRGNQPAVATHDERLIQLAQDIARREGIRPEKFDFEMLFGVRRDLQLRLAQQGYRVRVYVPYGQEWYPYLVRRLAERPANVAFFARSVLQEAMAGRRNGQRS
ncbi:MAG: proline dehydrogenase family protein [Chloroflexi bacterium]|nr:proline dehydrogenase family protein [Chloroflexota bacterium]